MIEAMPYRDSCHKHKQSFVIDHVSRTLYYSKDECPFCTLEGLKANPVMTMDESESYKWASQAMRVLDSVEPHLAQQTADKIASAVREAFLMGKEEMLKEVWQFVREDCNPNYTTLPTTIAQKIKEKFGLEI